MHLCTYTSSHTHTTYAKRKRTSVVCTTKERSGQPEGCDRNTRPTLGIGLDFPGGTDGAGGQRGNISVGEEDVEVFMAERLMCAMG